MGKGSQNKLSSLETEPTTASESTSVITANNDSSVDSKLPFYDWDEIKKHSKRDDVWIVINDNVYDVTQFRKIHPGGSKLLNFYGGQDATEVFNAFHKEFDRVNKQSKIYKIGRVAPDQLSRHTKEAEIKRDFEELKQKAIKMNLFQPSYFFFFLQGVQILFFHIMGYVILAYYSHSIFGILASLLFLIIAQVFILIFYYYTRLCLNFILNKRVKLVGVNMTMAIRLYSSNHATIATCKDSSWA